MEDFPGTVMDGVTEMVLDGMAQARITHLLGIQGTCVYLESCVLDHSHMHMATNKGTASNQLVLSVAWMGQIHGINVLDCPCQMPFPFKPSTNPFSLVLSCGLVNFLWWKRLCLISLSVYAGKAWQPAKADVQEKHTVS